MVAERAATITASGALAGIGALHVAWGLGSSWPEPDRASLADTVAGTDAMPGPPACFAVAGALTVAALLVSGHPRRRPALRRLGAAGVVTVLAARGAIGAAGLTDRMVPGAVSPRFRRLDRRYFSPLCLVLAALSAPAALRR